MTFRDREKRRYEAIKPGLFSKQAQLPGIYRNRRRLFCLAEDCSPENLHESLRDDAIAYFRRRGIPWHDGLPDPYGNEKALPSNHLCCSQCMCVNCLAPMMHDPHLLAEVFQVFLPELSKPLPFDADDPLDDGTQPFLAFEYVGTQNYLCESKWGTRGANCTSADFAFRFCRSDGLTQLVLGEWKYTEDYRGHKLPEPNNINPTRWKTYRQAFELWKSQQPLLPEYETFFVEPFYQLMRQTLLAQEMERAREIKADIVNVLHISPEANREFAYVFPSPAFGKFGSTVTEAWKALAPAGRFIPIYCEDLLRSIERCVNGTRSAWVNWLLRRYAWWKPDRSRRFVGNGSEFV
jgi:hypothetical protein